MTMTNDEEEKGWPRGRVFNRTDKSTLPRGRVSQCVLAGNLSRTSRQISPSAFAFVGF